jgi:hypothetical protein
MKQRSLRTLLARNSTRKSTEERLAYLEGHRTASQASFSLLAALFGLLGGIGIYQTFIQNIQEEVDTQVATVVAGKAAPIFSAAQTADAAQREVALVGTAISREVNPTATPSPSIGDAERTISDYYGALTAGNYALAWSMLSTGFRDRSGQASFEGYEAFWKGIKQVEVVETALTASDTLTATFLVRLKYTQGSGQPWENSYFHTLVFEPQSGSWKIDSVAEA